MRRLAQLTMLAAKTERERELVIFGQLAPDALERLPVAAVKTIHVKQYEWKQDNSAKGGLKSTLRMRESITSSKGKPTQEPEYEITTKAYNGPGDAIESNVESNAEMFRIVQDMAPSGHHFLRFCFPIEGTKLVWEVDVMFDKSGERMVPWAKLDLEVPADYDGEMPEPPEGFFTRMIDKPYAQRTQEENQILDDLFKNHFYFNNQQD